MDIKKRQAVKKAVCFFCEKVTKEINRQRSLKNGAFLSGIQRLLAENRISHAKKYGRFWMIPADAEKPRDCGGFFLL